MAECPFCRIVAGQAPAAIVFEDEGCLGFLDVRPLFYGHVLIAPKAHIDSLESMPSTLVEPLFSWARRLTAALPKALGCEGTFVAINNRVSQSVPHLHVHVVPRTKGDGLRGFFWPRSNYASVEEMEQIRSRIAAQLSHPGTKPAFEPPERSNPAT